MGEDPRFFGPAAYSKAVEGNADMKRLRENLDARAAGGAFPLPQLDAYDSLFSSFDGIARGEAHAIDVTTFERFTMAADEVASFDPLTAFDAVRYLEKGLFYQINFNQSLEISALIGDLALRIAGKGREVLDTPHRIDRFYEDCVEYALEGMALTPHQGAAEIHALQLLRNDGVEPLRGGLRGEFEGVVHFREKLGHVFTPGTNLMMKRLEHVLRPAPEGM